MGDVAQISAWGLYAYGWLCLFFFIVSLRNAVSNEISEKTRVVARWAPRRASWAPPVLCLLMAEVAWYLARVFG
jgi:hypothetical protein